MVQYVFEFLQFLRFLFKFVNFSLICINGLITFRNNRSLLLDFFLKGKIRFFQSFNLIIVLPLLFHILLFFLFLLWNFLLGDGNLTLRPKRRFCKFLYLFSILTFDLIHFFIPLFIDLFHSFLMLLLKPLNFLNNIFLPLFLILYLLLVILLQFS